MARFTPRVYVNLATSPTMNLAIDHVVECVPDLDEAAESYVERHGVASIPGGRHTGQGTANRLIPFGDNYIELISVVDPDEAKTSGLGNWVAQRVVHPGADAVCLRTDDIGALSARLGLTPVSMNRVTPEGHVLEWSLAGLKMMMTAGLPFFIQWNVPEDMHPARTPIEHPAGPVGLGDVFVHSEDARLSEWLNGTPGVFPAPGPAGVTFTISPR